MTLAFYFNAVVSGLNAATFAYTGNPISLGAAVTVGILAIYCGVGDSVRRFAIHCGIGDGVRHD